MPESALADAESELEDAARSRSEGERPWSIRDELGSSMLENFGVFRREEQMEEQVEIIAACGSATSG